MPPDAPFARATTLWRERAECTTAQAAPRWRTNVNEGAQHPSHTLGQVLT